MRLIHICLCAALVLLSLPPTALAHRVNVFAFVDGGEIQVECAFSRGNPARHSKIEVCDAAADTVLLTGVTGEDGIFRFAIPEDVRNQSRDLIVRVNAGEGHQGEWRILAAELDASSLAAVPATGADQGGVAVPLPVLQSEQSGQAGQSISLTPQELERIIDAALEQKLAPIRQMLAEQYNADPSWRDIIGGIGWLLGLAGMAAYFKSRRS